MQQDAPNKLGWNEQDSRAFIDFGQYFVPDREVQIQTICNLIPPHMEPFHIVELCCGEGLLAAALLEQFPTCIVHGFDRSPEMLQHAQLRLAQFNGRFTLQVFDLAAPTWRNLAWPVHAVVSSLAIHHLDAQQKQDLYRDVYRMLVAEGVFIIADVIQPVHHLGVVVAARAWDDAVRHQSLKLDGNTRAFDVFLQDKWNLYRHPDPIDKPSRLFEQLKWLEQAGFVDVDVYWMKAGHAIFGGRRTS